MSASTPVTVTRAQWGARPPRSVTTVAWSRRTGVAIHHSAGSETQTVRTIQNFHMDNRGWPDIGYNFLVDRLGNLYTGRGWTVMGTHSAGENISHVAVCYIGNTNNVVVPEPARNAIRWVYEEACRRAGRTLTFAGHGQLPDEATACPGDNLKSWIAAGMPLAGESEDDMEQSETLIEDTGLASRTVGDTLADLENLRNWWVSSPGATGPGRPPAGSVGAIVLHAAQNPSPPAPVDIDALVAALRPHLESAAEAAVRKVLGGLDETG